MTNWEKYKETFLKITACGSDFAVDRTGKIVACGNLLCADCLFKEETCTTRRMKWLDEEYIEPKKSEIDWSKVPVDTPVLAWDGNDNLKCRSHFAKYENNKIYTFADGRTSHTAKVFPERIYWDHVEIAPGIDCSKWYKEE